MHRARGRGLRSSGRASNPTRSNDDARGIHEQWQCFDGLNGLGEELFIFLFLF
jgi:hypothetical protein